MIRIEIVTSGTDTSGFIVAVETADRAPGTGYDWDATGTALVVGQVHRESPGGETDLWRAWLWRQPTTYPPTGQHCEAIDVTGRDRLAARLYKRYEDKGAWWK